MTPSFPVETFICFELHIQYYGSKLFFFVAYFQLNILAGVHGEKDQPVLMHQQQGKLMSRYMARLHTADFVPLTDNNLLTLYFAFAQRSGGRDASGHLVEQRDTVLPALQTYFARHCAIQYHTGDPNPTQSTMLEQFPEFQRINQVMFPKLPQTLTVEEIVRECCGKKNRIANRNSHIAGAIFDQ